MDFYDSNLSLLLHNWRVSNGERRFPFLFICIILKQLLLAVRHLKSNGIVHRLKRRCVVFVIWWVFSDLKEDNILVRHFSEDYPDRLQVCICDFGTHLNTLVLSNRDSRMRIPKGIGSNSRSFLTVVERICLSSFSRGCLRTSIKRSEWNWLERMRYLGSCTNVLSSFWWCGFTQRFQQKGRKSRSPVVKRLPKRIEWIALENVGTVKREKNWRRRSAQDFGHIFSFFLTWLIIYYGKRLLKSTSRYSSFQFDFPFVRWISGKLIILFFFDFVRA